MPAMRAGPALSAECRLVFRTADPALRPDEVRALCAAVRDWRRVLVLADRELAAAAVWTAIEGAPGASVPPAVAEHLRSQALVTGFRMQRLAQRLADTLGVMRAHGIPVMLLKGAALGARTDPTFRARPMADLDLLVRPADRERAETALVAAGWRRSDDPTLTALLADAHHGPPFIDPAVRDLRVELHTRLLPPEYAFAFGDEETFWRDALPAGAPFSGSVVPSPVHQLLHAATHFAWAHGLGFGAWRTFRTMNTLLADPALDASRIEADARAARALTACHWTLRLGERLSGAPVPAALVARMAPPTPAPVLRALERHFITSLAPGEGPACPSARLRHILWWGAIRPRWSGHPRAVGWERDERWLTARGGAGPSTFAHRMRRQLLNAGRWWAFAVRTLGGLRAGS